MANVYLTNANEVTKYADRIRPLVANMPFELRDRIGMPFIKLTKEVTPKVFSDLGIKIWFVKEDGLTFNVSFALSGSVKDGMIQPRPKKDGNFNFSLGGWTTIDVAADRDEDKLTIEVGDAGAAALSNLAAWCAADKSARPEKPPALWWDLSEATVLVLVPVLKLDVEVYSKDSAGNRIPDGAGSFKKEHRDILSWSFMYLDADLHGEGIHGAGISAADLASVDANQVLRLV